MKATKIQLKQLIKEEIQNDDALLHAIEKLTSIIQVKILAVLAIMLLANNIVIQAIIILPKRINSNIDLIFFIIMHYY